MRSEKIINEMNTQNNIDILKKHFPNCFDKNGDFLLEKFKEEILQGEVNFSKESYGLEWLGKSYARVLATETPQTLLRED